MHLVATLPCPSRDAEKQGLPFPLGGRVSVQDSFSHGQTRKLGAKGDDIGLRGSSYAVNKNFRARKFSTILTKSRIQSSIATKLRMLECVESFAMLHITFEPMLYEFLGNVCVHDVQGEAMEVNLMQSLVSCDNYITLHMFAKATSTQYLVAHVRCSLCK